MDETLQVGLDMAVPAAYENYDINIPLIRLGKFATNIGLTILKSDFSTKNIY